MTSVRARVPPAAARAVTRSRRRRREGQGERRPRGASGRRCQRGSSWSSWRRAGRSRWSSWSRLATQVRVTRGEAWNWKKTRRVGERERGRPSGSFWDSGRRCGRDPSCCSAARDGSARALLRPPYGPPQLLARRFHGHSRLLLRDHLQRGARLLLVSGATCCGTSFPSDQAPSSAGRSTTDIARPATWIPIPGCTVWSPGWPPNGSRMAPMAPEWPSNGLYWLLVRVGCRRWGLHAIVLPDGAPGLRPSLGSRARGQHARGCACWRT